MPAPSLPSPPQSPVCTALAAPVSSFLTPTLGSCPHSHPSTPSSRKHPERSTFSAFVVSLKPSHGSWPYHLGKSPRESRCLQPAPTQTWNSCGTSTAAPCNSPHPHLPWERFIKAQPSAARGSALKLSSFQVQKRLVMLRAARAGQAMQSHAPTDGGSRSPKGTAPSLCSWGCPQGRRRRVPRRPGLGAEPRGKRGRARGAAEGPAPGQEPPQPHTDPSSGEEGGTEEKDNGAVRPTCCPGRGR